MALDTIPKQEGGKLKAVASGTLPSGQPVVVNADGTVSVVAESTVNTPSLATNYNYGGTPLYNAAVYDSNSNKVVIAYEDRDLSTEGTAIVGTVSGETITFGTPVSFSSGGVRDVGATFDSTNNKVVISYNDSNNSSYGTAVVGTVSGTSISFGANLVFESNATYNIHLAYDSNSNDVVIAYKANIASNQGKCAICSVSGTSLLRSDTVTFTNRISTVTRDMDIGFDSNLNKFLIVYKDEDNSNYGTAIVGTISGGTTLSLGTPVVFNAGETSHFMLSFDTNENRFLSIYSDVSPNTYGKARVATISGSSVSFGTEVTFFNDVVGSLASSYDPVEDKTLVIVASSTAVNKIATATISGTSVTFGTLGDLADLDSQLGAVYDSNAQKVLFCGLNSQSNGVAAVGKFTSTGTNLTSENYIGMSGGVAISETLDTTEFQDSNTTQYVSSVYDVNAERVVIAYLNNDTSNGTGGCIVGEINGANITFGSFTTFSTGTQISDISLTYDSTNNKCVVSYQFASNTGQSKVATVDPSDNSITFGSAAQYSSEADQITSIFDDSSGKVVLAFRSKEAATEFDILARVGTVSGTSISWGTAVTVSSVSSQWVSLGNDVDSNKIVFAYLASSEGKSKVGTVSGTTISFGSEATFTTNATYISSMAYHNALDKMILTYRDSGNSNYPTSVVGTVSGTSISFGTPVVLNSAYGGTSKRASAYDPVNQKVFTVYGPTGGSIIQDLTASGTTLVKGATTALGQEAAFQCLTYIPSLEKMLITYKGTDNDGYATLFVPEERGSVADGNSASIDIIGSVSTNQSGLTAGQQYYVQTDGTIGETPADPSVLAGTAVSATKLLVKT